MSNSFVTPWTVACLVSLSMGFSRQEYWSGVPFPSPRDLLNPGIEPRSPALQAGALTSEPPGKHSIWDECNYVVFVHSLALSFFGIRKKTYIFQSFGHCWVFHVCWHIEYSACTASSFSIWNNSTGISSSPLSLFIVMLPKGHLTSHPRISGSR